MTRPKVLFLSHGNSARSQMAEALLRHCAPSQFEAYSAGLEADDVNPLAVRVMAERGIDLGGHRSKLLADFVGDMEFAYVITVDDRAERECPELPGVGTRLHWSFPDAAHAEGTELERLEAFRIVRDAIEASIRLWLDKTEQEKAEDTDPLRAAS
jgi:arsenate reductase